MWICCFILFKVHSFSDLLSVPLLPFVPPQNPAQDAASSLGSGIVWTDPQWDLGDDYTRVWIWGGKKSKRKVQFSSHLIKGTCLLLIMLNLDHLIVLVRFFQWKVLPFFSLSTLYVLSESKSVREANT